MKILLTITLILAFSSSNHLTRDCSGAHSSADDAYEYSRKAYNEDDLDYAKSYLKKAMNSFDDSMSEAQDCDCDDAYSSADDGFTYAKRGYNADDLDELQGYAKKARGAAEEAMSHAEDCDNNYEFILSTRDKELRVFCAAGSPFRGARG
jgi:hypothetical protein